MARFDLAPIGNGAVASLIDGTGRHVWFCFPRLDGDPVFNALVNGEAPASGFMDVLAEGLTATSLSYLYNTAILETRMQTSAGAQFRILDFAPRFRMYGRNFRPPMLVRRIEPVAGHPRLVVRVRPNFEYGAVQPHKHPGSNHVRFASDDRTLRLTSDLGLSYIVDEQAFQLDRPINLFVGLDESPSGNPDALAKQFLHETEAYWTEWVRRLAIPFEWQSAVIRSAIVLKLCSFEETGAVVAALTTSLPEAPHSARNWDYRFCWLRDAYFTVNALNRLSATRTMEQFVRFMLDFVVTGDARDLCPLYPIVASTPRDEHNATALAGYCGMGPVRVGNAAWSQRQHDAFGSVVLSTAQLFWDARLDRGDGRDLYERLCIVGRMAVERALMPDAGVWEYRGRTHIHTYSVAMCWAATHRLALIARRVGATDDAADWDARAQAIREELFKRARTAEGWISGALDESVVDASTLLLPQLGLLPADSDTFLKTLAMLEKRLLRRGFMLRYDAPDDFGAPEAAFIVCTFWYVDALAAVGRKEEARLLFEHVLAHRTPLGLLSEDLDPQTGELWGNFPQAYSHVGLINSAFRLSRSWEEGLWRA